MHSGQQMKASQSQTRISLNPWVHHLKKLNIELECPHCLNLLDRPALLPCDHILCNSCLPRSAQFDSECPVCNQKFGDGEIRLAPYMENIVAIYRSLDATLTATLRQSASSDTVRASEQCPVSAKTTTAKIQKENVETTQEGSTNGKSIFSLTANKLFNDCVEDGIEKTGKPRVIHDEELDMGGSSGEMDFNVDDKQIELGREKIGSNRMEQFSPPTDPPSCIFIDIDGKRSDPRSSNGNLQKSARKRSLQNDSNLGVSENLKRCTTEAKCESTDAKRQKILNSDHNGSKLPHYENKTSECKLESKFGQSTLVSDPLDVSKSVCAFCYSSKITDRTGPMLHILNGEEIEGDVGATSKVIHVHRKCFDWAPQVYHEDGKIMNLEREIARAAKLSCSSCGKKGAALGCFVNSCRKSYHPPCALDVDCIWDSDAFLVLCPTHKSWKFPRETSKSKKYKKSTQINSEQPNIWSSPCGAKEWVFCWSGLSAEEKCHLVNFASKYDAPVLGCWKPNVTHVIVSTNEKCACKRTLKVLMAILNGRWILSMDWVKACIEAEKPLDEEPYEVSLDNHGFRDGPRTGRRRASNNAPKLFNSLSFLFSGEFESSYKTELRDLVEAAGGTVIESGEKLVAQNCDAQSTTTAILVVYNCDPPQQASQGGTVISHRLAKANKLANEIGCRVIKHTWILDSIAAYKKQYFPLFSSPNM